MQENKLDQLLKKRAQLFTEISKLSGLLHGSWLERYSTCTRTECKCHQGQRHGPNYCLVVNEDGKQRQKYIPQLKVDIAKKGLAQYKQLQKIVDQITLINLAILKEEAKRESS
jgi:hypothetical protein